MTGLDTESEPAPSSVSEGPVVRRDRARRARGGAEPVVVRPEPAQRTRRERKTVVHPAHMWVWVVLTLAATAGLVTLAWQGYGTSLDIRGGVDSNVTDPTKPGYEAQVQPTSTHLLLATDEGRVGDAYLLVEGSGGKGGAVLFIPGLIVVTVDDTPYNLAELAEAKGVPAVVDALQDALGMGVTDAAELTPDDVADLVGPAAPLTIENPDALVRDGETVFPAGTLELSADEVADYLFLVNVGESIVNRPVRAAAVWEAWMERLAADAALAPSDTSLAPLGAGEPVAVAAVIAGLAQGRVDYQQLPVDRLEVPDQGGFAVYRPDAEGIADTLARLVPFPTSAYAGQRTRVRLLRGTADDQSALRATQPIVASGAEIRVLGNAGSVDVATTRVEFNSPAQRDAANQIAEQLGVGAATAGTESDAVDVTVTIGADFTG